MTPGQQCGVHRGLWPTLSAGSSELERRVSAESGCPTPLALVLWILEEVSAWPTSSVGAEAVG